MESKYIKSKQKIFIKEKNLSKDKLPLLSRICYFLFTAYFSSLYIFVDKEENLIISQIIFIIFALSAFIKIISSQNKKIVDKYFYFIGAFVLYSYITTIWAFNFSTAFIKSNTLLQIFILCICVYITFIDLDRTDYFIKSMLIAGFALCIYSFNLYGVSYILNSFFENTRIGADISQENVFGMLNSITCIVCLFYALHYNKYYFYLISIIPAVLAMSSGSRKSLLMIAIAIIILLYLKTGKDKLFQFIIKLIIFIIIFYIIIQIPALDFIRLRFEGVINFITGEGKVDNSTLQRSYMISYGFEKFLENPFGYGNANFALLYGIERGSETYAHNNYIELLVNFGFIGFVVFYSIYIYMCKNLFKLINKKEPIYALFFAILLIYLIADFAVVSYYNKIYFTMFVISFVLIANKKTYEKEPQD